MSAFAPYQSNEQYHYYKYIQLDLTQDLNTDIPLVVPSDPNIRLLWESIQIDNRVVRGPYQVYPQFELRSGTTLLSNPVTPPIFPIFLQDQSIRITYSQNVTGPVPVTTGGNGTTTGNHLFLRIGLEGIGLQTATRSRTSGVAQIATVLPHGFLVGDQVRVRALGGVGYNGLYTVTGVPSATLFNYVNSGVDELPTADLTGNVGAITADAHILVLETV